jgi:hypothetical protein
VSTFERNYDANEKPFTTINAKTHSIAGWVDDRAVIKFKLDT